MANFSLDPHLAKQRMLNSFRHYLQVTSKTLAKQNFQSSRMSMLCSKPPNILVYSSKEFDLCAKECPVTHFAQCVSGKRYVVYKLTWEQSTVAPWMENSQLLVFPSTDSDSKSTAELYSQSELKAFQDFLSVGGRILNFSSNFAKLFNISLEKIDEQNREEYGLTDVGGSSLPGIENWLGYAITPSKDSHSNPFIYATAKNGQQKTIAISNKSGKGAIVHCMLPCIKSCKLQVCDGCSSLTDDCKQIIHLCLAELNFSFDSITPETISCLESVCFLNFYDENSFNNFFTSIHSDPSEQRFVKGNSLSLKLNPVTNSIEYSINGGMNELEDVLPVMYQMNGNLIQNAHSKFDWNVYFKHLNTVTFGKVLFYADVLPSTMDVLDALFLYVTPINSMLCIASQQTKGKGRGGNKWISPLGTAMFSLSLSIPLHSQLGQHLSILQHFVTVAVVHAVRTIPGLEDINLRVKWPNDIYFANNVKVGGVLVKCTVLKDKCLAMIGCGVNVNNSLPTTCINDIIQDLHPNHRRLSCEEVIARTLNILEQLINDYQKEGPEGFLKLYYKYWVHSMAKVQVQLKVGDGYSLANATITGIDEAGFLKVALRSGGEEISLQPDGNSFDITKNLIAIKTRP